MQPDRPVKYRKILDVFEDAYKPRRDDQPGSQLQRVYDLISRGGSATEFRPLSTRQRNFLSRSENQDALKTKLMELVSARGATAASATPSAFDTWKYGAAAATAVCRPAYLGSSSFIGLAEATQVMASGLAAVSALVQVVRDLDTAAEKSPVMFQKAQSSARAALAEAAAANERAARETAAAAAVHAVAANMMFEVNTVIQSVKTESGATEDVLTVIPTDRVARIVMFSDKKGDRSTDAELDQLLDTDPCNSILKNDIALAKQAKGG